MPGVSFAGTWEIETYSTVVREFRTVTSLAGVGELRAGASFADFGAHRGSTSLQEGWKIWSVTPLADVCRMGIGTTHLNTNKSEGAHEIHPKILTSLASFLATPLAKLYNNSLATGKILVECFCSSLMMKISSLQEASNTS